MILPARRALLAGAAGVVWAALAPAGQGMAAGRTPQIDAMVARHARAHDVPESLVHRVIQRESRYDPRVVARGNYGLMQIKPGTARGMGFSGKPGALLDPDVNLAYAVPYLANAWRVAKGNADLAVRYYAGGWYYAAKRQGLLGQMRTARSAALAPAVPSEASSAASPDPGATVEVPPAERMAADSPGGARD